MALSRASLGRGPAIVTWNGGVFFMRDSLIPKHSPVWKPVGCTHLGQIDKYRSDMVIKHQLQLFGLWSNLDKLFPSALLNPVVGTSLFGTDLPLVIQAKDGMTVTYANTQLTKLVDVFLGVDEEMFSATVEFTSLISNTALVTGGPEIAGAYFTRASTAYAEATFALTNFLKTRWTAVWTGKTGFTSFIGEKGFHISWALDLKPHVVDGYGTVEMVIGEGGLVGTMKCVPIGPTAAQSDTAQANHAANGTLLGAGGADLTMTALAGTHVVLLKTANLVETSSAFGIEPLRVNEHTWETTRVVTSGAVAGVATVS